MTQEQLAALAKGLAPVVRECVATATAPLLDQIAALQAEVARMVAEAVDALPKPEDGKSVTIEDVGLLVDEQVRAAVDAAIKTIPVPCDGRDGLDAVTPILKDGVLLFTMSDGSVKEVGRVAGRDGDPGKPGKDGRDGFQLENFDAKLMDDGRTILLSFEQQDLMYSVELGVPAMIYRGVYKEGSEYEKGDTVTWGGSLWHCDTEKTAEKPDSSEKHWTLAAKRGRDGKDGGARP